MEIKTIELRSQPDSRGWSVDIFRRSTLAFNLKYVYLINSKPKTIRGNHYHEKKNEWFCLIKGKVRFTLVDNKTQEKKVFELSDTPIILLNIPPGISHAIENITEEEVYILELADQEFDPANPDTFRKQIV